jgi:hypothetical protein
MPLKGELGHVDLVPVAGSSTYRSIASMRARASTSASVHAVGKSGVLG